MEERLEMFIHYSATAKELLDQLYHVKANNITEISSYCSEYSFKVETLIDLISRWDMIGYEYSEIVLHLLNLCVEE